MNILLRRFYLVMPLGILMGIVLCAQVANAKLCKGSLVTASKYVIGIPGMWCAKKESGKYLTHDCNNYYVKWHKTNTYVQCKSSPLTHYSFHPNKYACAPNEKDLCTPPKDVAK